MIGRDLQAGAESFHSTAPPLRRDPANTPPDLHTGTYFAYGIVTPDGGLLKVEMGGVCGTDVKYLHGKLQVPYPIILGHEILARVEKLGRNAAQIHKIKEGDRVILKGALGCGRCADCRRNNQRFCRQHQLRRPDQM